MDLCAVTGFTEFIQSSGLTGRLDSLVLFTSPCSPQGSDDFSFWRQLVEIVDLINAPSLTIILPPTVFAKIIPYEFNSDHAWAYSIECQVLHLETPRELVASKTPEYVVGDGNIFAIRPWSHCVYNEGSSVGAYSTYEYYLKRIPCLLSPSNFHQFVRTVKHSLDHIISLDLIAVFPFNQIWAYSNCISSMKSLRTLRTQLAPTPSNNILDDPSSLRKGQTNDLWMEFEISYGLLVDLVAGREGVLMGSLELEQFIILDYANPDLRKTIDDVVGDRLDEWERDPNGGRWTRTRDHQKTISQ